jgi:PAS domain S-box-containing protein
MNFQLSDDVLKDSPFAWWEWDVETNHVHYNELKTKMLGYAPGEFKERGYQSFTELIHPEDLEKSMDAMKSVLYGDLQLYQVDYRIRSKDGSYRWFMDRGMVIARTREGRPSAIRGIVIDLGREGAFTGSEASTIEIVQKSIRLFNGYQSSVLTVCSVYKKVKRDVGEYVELSSELRGLLGTRISHGICPDCLTTLLPDFKMKAPELPPDPPEPR